MAKESKYHETIEKLKVALLVAEQHQEKRAIANILRLIKFFENKQKKN